MELNYPLCIWENAEDKPVLKGVLSVWVCSVCTNEFSLIEKFESHIMECEYKNKTTSTEFSKALLESKGDQIRVKRAMVMNEHCDDEIRIRAAIDMSYLYDDYLTEMNKCLARVREKI